MRNRASETESSETVNETGTRASRRGFGGYNKAVDSLNQTTFQVKDDSEVIVFLDDENFFYEMRHWIKFPGDNGQQQTRAEWCLGEDEDGMSVCPLCDIGDTPKPVAFFNVVDVSNPKKVLVWEASSDPTKAVEKEYKKLAKLGKHLNDDGLYWVISKEQGRNGYWTYSVDRVTEEELGVNWKSLTPVGPEKREALRGRAHDESYVEYKTQEELLEFANSLP